jgi:hypothetical protein
MIVTVAGGALAPHLRDELGMVCGSFKQESGVTSSGAARSRSASHEA